MIIDLHAHTPRCGHASGSPSEYVAAARAAGVDVLAFTDHLPLPEDYPGAYAMPACELADYVADIQALREQAAAAGDIELLLGIEADFIPGREGDTAAALAQHSWDVVLGSVHFQGGWAFDDPDETDGYAQRRIDDVWTRYFADLALAARSGLFDVITHPDLVKKFNFVPEGDLTGYYEPAIAAMAEAGVAYEVNTAGLRKPCGELYPAPAFLRLAHAAGIPVTMGSDAHRPEEVGTGLDAARAALLDAGYRSVLVFRDRIPEEVAL
jgi:histidinol-phosphatase (PHP family)